MKMEQNPIYKKIDEILWFDWDPIGVNIFEDARDEYWGYLPLIFRLKINGAGEDEIAKTLHKIETDNMGLTGDFEHCRVISQKILEIE
jgi:hypothetical protein